MKRALAILVTGVVVPLLWDGGLLADDDAGPVPGHGLGIDLTLAGGEVGQGFKLLAGDGAARGNFGCSVSINGDFAVVGARGDDDRGYNSGSVSVFKQTGDTWVQQARLTASDGDARDRFGAAVSISGDYLIVGTDEYDDWDRSAGSAYVFKRNGDAWVQQTKLVASDGQSADHFGVSVSINGDDAIVGAWGDDDTNHDAGSAYVFKRNGETWVQQAKLVAPDGESADHFGVSVSISGDDAIVGANLDDDRVVNGGSAYVFKRSGDAWIRQARLVASDGYVGDVGFGVSVCISGDDAIVGADGYFGMSSGLACVFNRHGDAWTQQAKLVASDGKLWDRFGYSVSISGDYAIVGADTNDEKGNDSGAAYLFKRSGETWTQYAKLMAPDSAAGDYFGMSVSISGDHAIAGAWGGDDEGAASGCAYVFRISPPTFALKTSVYPPGAGSVHIMAIIDGVARGWLTDQALRFDKGTEITLLAVPDPGYAFTNWSGTIWSTDNGLTFTLDQDHSLTANFVPAPSP